MVSIVHEYNLFENKIIERLGESASFGEPTNFEIKVVYRKNEGNAEWQLCSAAISKVCGDSGRFEQEYPEAAFFSFVTTFDSVQAVFQGLLNGVVVKEGHPALKTYGGTRWEEVLIPSVSSPSGLPVRHYSLRLDSCNFGDKSLVGYRLPFYSSTLERVVEFIPYEQKGSNHIHLLIDDERACIKVEGEQVTVVSEKGVHVSGQFVRGGEVEKIDAMSEELGVLDLHDLESAEVWALNENNLVLDYLSTSAYPHRFELPVQDVSFEEHIKTKVEDGETVDCEFKEYIDLDNGGSKREDIEKTVCALSNTEGGVLIIGISDYREVLGIDDSVQRKYRSSLDKAVSAYLDGVRKRLYETLTVNDCFTVEPVALYGKTVIVVSVEKIDGWNFLQATNLAYARKGSTCYVASRLVELELENMRRAGRDLF